jgi:hypothetical protein
MPVEQLQPRPELTLEKYEIHRADGVDTALMPAALRRIHNLGLDHLPVCIAKTQYSFSDDPAKLGAATDFEITVNDIEIAAGAGFVVPILGKMMRMPGLPETRQGWTFTNGTGGWCVAQHPARGSGSPSKCHWPDVGSDANRWDAHKQPHAGSS